MLTRHAPISQTSAPPKSPEKRCGPGAQVPVLVPFRVLNECTSQKETQNAAYSKAFDGRSEFAGPDLAMLPIVHSPRGRRYRFRSLNRSGHAKCRSGCRASSYIIVFEQPLWGRTSLRPTLCTNVSSQMFFRVFVESFSPGLCCFAPGGFGRLPTQGVVR